MVFMLKFGKFIIHVSCKGMTQLNYFFSLNITSNSCLRYSSIEVWFEKKKKKTTASCYEIIFFMRPGMGGENLET